MLAVVELESLCSGPLQVEYSFLHCNVSLNTTLFTNKSIEQLFIKLAFVKRLELL
jgi:hypothetical protein